MDQEKDEKRKRLDLSMAQVSGSAVAAVVAAKLASTLGVYGTILGAGVISVIATCGGSVFQHLFKRTGEQIRVVAVHPEPVKSVRREAPERTRVLATVGEPLPPPGDGEFGEATTHGTRVRGWKRPTVAAALVFLVAMGGITGYELIAGQDFSGTRGTTTFGSAVGGGGSAGEATDEKPPTGESPARNQDGGPSPEAGTTQGATPDTGRNTPEPAPSGSAGGDPTPTPSTPAPTPTASTHTPAPTGTPSGEAGVQQAPPAGTGTDGE